MSLSEENSTKSQTQLKEFKKSKNYCKTAPYLINRLCIHSLIQKKLHNSLWTMLKLHLCRGVSPHCQNTDYSGFSSVQQNFCNTCCAKHLNVGWAGFAATVTKTPCNALPQWNLVELTTTKWWRYPIGHLTENGQTRTFTKMHMSTSVSSCHVPKPNT